MTTWSGGDPQQGGRVLAAGSAELHAEAMALLARLLPLEVGKRYEFERYFKEDGNPATVEVLRREEIRVPAGRFQTVVLRPEIRTDGLFGEGGEAEVYITDDERRIPVRLTTSLSVGSGNLFLTGYESGDGGSLIAPAGERDESP